MNVGLQSVKVEESYTDKIERPSQYLSACMHFVVLRACGGLAQLVATLVGSTKLLYAGPG